MSQAFTNVPVEEDTKILRREVITVSGHEVLHEKWSWDGVKGETFVFVSAAVASLSDAELEQLARQSDLLVSGSPITIERGESGYTFVNFNFRA